MLNKEDILNCISENLYEIFKKYECILAGGSIRSLYCQKLEYDQDYLKEDLISDLDIYFRDNIDFVPLVEELKKEGYINAYNSLNAITLIDKNENNDSLPIQIIRLDYTTGTPEEVIKKFDFSICSACYDFKEEKFYYDKNFEEDNKIRKLRYNIDGKFPIASLIRTNKYTKKKKYKISNVELLKIALCINNLNLKNYKELKEQLNGIDTLMLKPLTDNLLENEKYDIDEFLNSMEDYLEKANENINEQNLI